MTYTLNESDCLKLNDLEIPFIDLKKMLFKLNDHWRFSVINKNTLLIHCNEVPIKTLELNIGKFIIEEFLHSEIGYKTLYFQENVLGENEPTLNSGIIISYFTHDNPFNINPYIKIKELILKKKSLKNSIINQKEILDSLKKDLSVLNRKIEYHQQKIDNIQNNSPKENFSCKIISI